MSRLEMFLESDMKKLHIAIKDFLKKNPKPSDEQIHDLAKKMGVDEHEFEEHVYMMLADLLKESGETSDSDGFHVDIEKDTIENENYREALYTTAEVQLVLMSIKPGDEIGMETHKDGSQFIRIEKGIGTAIIGDKEYSLKDGSAIVIPSGVEHNVINEGTEDLKLYAVYAPPEHNVDVVQKDKEE